MARYRGQGRDTVEEITRLTLDDLKRLGYLQKGYTKSGLITLKQGDEETGSYNLTVSLDYPGALSEGTFYGTAGAELRARCERDDMRGKRRRDK